jgi:hypothetical protein
MTKTTINYENTVIYKIVCDDLAIKDCYVGHTTNFTKRKGQHKASCNKEGNNHEHYKVYRCIRENGGWDNWDMFEIEKFKCNDGNEARARERFHIESLGANLNVVIPTRTHKEYRESEGVKELIVEKSKIYYEDNKNIIIDKAKNYYESNKIAICERRKDYYESNKTAICERGKDYYIDNRDKINEQNKIRYICECGREIRKNEKSRHTKTKGHLKYLENLKSNDIV